MTQYELLKVNGDIDNSVLAGFVLADASENTLTTIALATGTKVLNGTRREEVANIGPLFVHDCHAEVLARRALQCWIWEHLDSHFVDGELQPHMSIHFYTSSPPCGDCCVHELQEGTSVQTGAKPFGCNQSELMKSPPNVVRGKPGRGPRSQSVSCSDKVCLWLNVGIEGALLSHYIKKLHLACVYAGGSRLETLERAFFSRVGRNAHTKVVVDVSSWSERNESPSAASYVWWEGSQGELIAAKCGRRFGVIAKRETDMRFVSRVCDAKMLERFCMRRGVTDMTLGEAKSSATAYLDRKSAIKTAMIAHGAPWCVKFEAETNWQLPKLA